MISQEKMKQIAKQLTYQEEMLHTVITKEDGTYFIIDENENVLIDNGEGELEYHPYPIEYILCAERYFKRNESHLIGAN
jgi:hypothetical protein